MTIQKAGCYEGGDKLSEILSLLDGVTGSGNQYSARCPAHDDKRASLSISTGNDGRILLHCHAGCDISDVLDALGIEKSELFPRSSASDDFKRPTITRNSTREVVARYRYTDENGVLLNQKTRFSDKSFAWSHLKDERWVKGRQGEPVLYNLPAVAASDFVFVVEGEKDVDTLRTNGYPAVCGADGAGPGKWLPQYTEALKDKYVAIIPDNDETGKAFAAETANALHGVAQSVKMLDLAALWPDIPEHGDTTDLVERFNAGWLEALQPLAERAPEWEPVALDPPKKPPIHECANVFESAAPEIVADPEADTATAMLTDEVITALFAMPDELAREREIIRLREIARGRRFLRDFDAIIKLSRAKHEKAKKKASERQNGRSEKARIQLHDIPLQGLICPDGWIVDSQGVRRMESGFIEWACSHPIIITERLENIDTSAASLTLSFYRDGRWKNVSVKCSTAANRQSIIQLADAGVLVNSENARSLVKYLGDLEAENTENIPLRKSIDRAGWIGDEEFFPFTPGYTFDGDSENVRRLNSMVTAGSEDIWLETVCKARDSSPLFRAMLAVSFAAPLLEPMGNLCFVMHLWGRTGTAKTVAAMAAMSVWGNPDILVQPFSGTRVGMERLAAFYHSLPLALDERETNKGSKDDSFDQTIYMLTEGHSAPKGTKVGGLRKSDYWKLPIISTGEAPLTADNSKGGAKNRVLELRVSENLFPDAPAMADAVKANYGWAGARWIDAIIKSRKKDELKDMRTMYKVMYSRLNAFKTYTDKQIASMSLVLLADYFSDVWIFKQEPGAAIKSTFQFAEEMSKFLVTRQEADIVANAWEFTQGWLARNRNHFNSLYDECWGVIDGTDVYVIADIFKDALNEAGYNPRASLQGFKDNGCLIPYPSENRLTFKKRINGVGVWCYRLKANIEMHNSEGEFPSYLQEGIPDVPE